MLRTYDGVTVFDFIELAARQHLVSTAWLHHYYFFNCITASARSLKSMKIKIFKFL